MAELLRENLINFDNKTFVNSRLLDQLAGVTISEKNRKLVPIVSSIIAGTALNVQDVLQTIMVDSVGRGHNKGVVAVAYGTMQLIIAGGCKFLPWTPTRRRYVREVINSRLVPEYDPSDQENEVAHPNRTQLTAMHHQPRRTIETATPTGSSGTAQPIVADNTLTGDGSATDADPNVTNTDLTDKQCLPSRADYKSRYLERLPSKWQSSEGISMFWKQVLKSAQEKEIGVDSFIKELMQHAEDRKKRARKSSSDENHLRLVVEALFPKCMTDREFFREKLFLAKFLGTWEDVLNSIRSETTLVGLGHNIVPSSSSIRSLSSKLTSFFIAAFRPSRTFSGFRIDLTRAVTLVCYVLYGKTDLADVQLDIWGDGANIGGLDVTRMAFRILNGKEFTNRYGQQCSAQASTAVFTFAIFRGTLFLFIYLLK